jgi:hypothetical protein
VLRQLRKSCSKTDTHSAISQNRCHWASACGSGQDGYPWKSVEHDLAEARRLILKHGYLRRMEELEDAETALLPRD